jgi:integrase
MADRDTSRVAPGASRIKPGSLHAALAKYFGCVAFVNGLASASQKSRRWLLEKFAANTGEHNAVPRGERQLTTLTHEALAKILGKMNPHPRRSLLKALRHFAQWAKTEGLIQHDPTDGMKLGRVPKTGGYYSWQESDIAKFEAVHVVGSKERLAFAIMLYTGLRRSDAIRLGPQHVRNGMVEFAPQKTSRSTGFTLRCPLHPELAKVIAVVPVIGSSTFLVSERGKPFGDAGCDVIQISAITGHRDLRELQVYVADRDQRLAAERAIAAMPGGSKGEQKLPNSTARFGKSARKSGKIKG